VLEHIKLFTGWAIEADRVAVSYRILNDGMRPVYVIDGGLWPGPDGAVDWSDRLTVEFRPPLTAVLASRLAPLNPAVHSVFPPAAFAVRLDAGKEHRSTLTAPLPLLPNGMTTRRIPSLDVAVGKRVVRPLSRSPRQIADRLLTCRKIIFELGLVPHDDALKPCPIKLAGRALVRLEKAAWSLQRVSTAVLEPAEISMRVPAAVAENTGPAISTTDRPLEDRVCQTLP
jgi:hypothetical protein